MLLLLKLNLNRIPKYQYHNFFVYRVIPRKFNLPPASVTGRKGYTLRLDLAGLLPSSTETLGAGGFGTSADGMGFNVFLNGELRGKPKNGLKDDMKFFCWVFFFGCGRTFFDFLVNRWLTGWCW